MRAMQLAVNGDSVFPDHSEYSSRDPFLPLLLAASVPWGRLSE